MTEWYWQEEHKAIDLMMAVDRINPQLAKQRNGMICMECGGWKYFDEQHICVE